jgi:hypothetical protein
MNNSFNSVGSVQKHITQANQTRDNIYAAGLAPGDDFKCRIFIGNDSKSFIGFTEDKVPFEANIFGTGTAYTLPVYNAAHEIANSHILDSPVLGILGALDAGNIGWTTVDGDITINAGIGSSSSTKGFLTLEAGAALIVDAPVVGIGCIPDDSGYLLQVGGSMKLNGSILSSTLGAGIYWASSALGVVSDVSGNLLLRTGSGDRVTIVAGGNVGIGTTPGAYKLDVYGDVNIKAGSKYKIGGTNLAYGDVGAEAAGAAAAAVNGDAGRIPKFTGAHTVESSIMAERNGYGIGIGIAVPGYMLDVAGDVNIQTGSHYKINGVNLAYGDVGACPALSLTQNRLPYAATAATLGDSNHSVTAEAIFLNGGSVISSSALGVGTPDPAYTADIRGTLRATGNAFLGGNVGIGTTSIRSKMDVAGGIDLSYTASQLSTNAAGIRWMNGSTASSAFGFVVNGGVWFQGAQSTNTDFGIRAATADGTLGAVKFVVKSDGKTGINTDTPYGLVQAVTASDTTPDTITAWDTRHVVIGAAGSASSGAMLLSYNQTDNYGIIQAIKPNIAWGNTILQSGGGLVGIRTAAPRHMLTVGSGIGTSVDAGITAVFLNKCAVADSSSRAVFMNVLDGYGEVLSYNYATSAWQNVCLARPSTAANVGIGVTAPTSKLEVAGDMYISAATGTATIYADNTYANGSTGISGNAACSNVIGLAIGVDGYADKSAGSAYGVRGNGTTADFYSPHNTYAYGSSRRWKSNIKTLEGSLDKILKLRGVSYDFDSAAYGAVMGQDGGGDRRGEIGIIAEELREVIPDLVEVDEMDKKYCTSVNTGRLIPVLIEAIKELNAKISLDIPK